MSVVPSLFCENRLVNALAELQRMNRHAHWFAFNRFAPPCEFVELLAADLLRRIHWRHLLDLSAQARQRCFDFLFAPGTCFLCQLERAALPVTSPVSVANPSRITASYSLTLPLRNCASRVALPTRTIKTPVANGSSVPVCPTRRSPTIRRTRATTS